jgi:MFS family permease
MFQRYVGERAYSPEQTRRWLRWLAQNMQRDFLSEFLLERLPPTWLPNRRLYTIIITLLVGPFPGLMVGCWGVGVGIWMGDFFGADVGWLVGGIVALLTALVVGMSIGQDIANKDTVSPVYSLRWAEAEVHRRLVIFGLVSGLPVGLAFGLVVGLVDGLLAGLVWGLISVLWIGPLVVLNTVTIEQLQIPNQGIHRSLRSGLMTGLLTGLGFMFGSVLIFIWGAILSSGWEYGLMVGLVVGLVFGLVFGLWAGFGLGGEAVVQHHVLRFVLWRQGVVPLNYVRFLNYACGLLFLQRDGAIYRFRHPMLQDYFARLKEDKPGARGKGR